MWIEITGTEIKLKKPMDGTSDVVLPILFETSSDVIQPKYDRVLDEIAHALLKHYPTMRVRIEGHADGEIVAGKKVSSEEMSRKRANGVRNALIGRGVPGERLVGRGYGDLKPLYHERGGKQLKPNERGKLSKDELRKLQEAERKNRRVELKILSDDREDDGGQQ